jgi:DNA-binding NarL/FixJ family response regulator
MTDLIRVLLADDHEPMRRAIRGLLELEPMIRIVGEASDYGELLKKLRDRKADVIVMDVHMPDLAQIDALSVKRQLGGSCLIAISFAKDEETRGLAESLGAFRLLDKIDLGQTLVGAIEDCTRQTAGV